MFSLSGLHRLAVLNFGRRQPFTWPMPAEQARSLLDDAKLFATTFVAGLMFMTVYLA